MLVSQLILRMSTVIGAVFLYSTPFLPELQSDTDFPTKLLNYSDNISPSSKRYGLKRGVLSYLLVGIIMIYEINVAPL